MYPAPGKCIGSFESGATNHVERRSRCRFSISLDLEYKLIYRRHVLRKGSGRTLEISSRGVLFAVNERLPRLTSIELCIDWPFPLKGLVSAKLVMRGRVVRNEGERVAVKFARYRFRPARVPSSIASSDSDSHVAPAIG